MSTKTVITILGSAGGAAKAVLSLLDKATNDQKNPIHSFLKNCKLHLIDQTQKEEKYYSDNFPHLENKVKLHQFNLSNTNIFMEHLQKSKTTHVIDLSWADTIEMMKCCNELGVFYINTALEFPLIDEDEDLEGFTLIERYLLFEQNKKQLNNLTAIVCSGMNPGVVQWMAIELMRKNKDKQPVACYIVEQDNSFYKNKLVAKKDTVYVSWSPECFLDEAILNFPMYVSKHTPLFLYEEVYENDFKVSLGEKQFYGCLMPHEEVLTLGSLFNIETGFIYQVNDHTTKLIRDHLDDVDVLWNKDMKLLDPAEEELEGEDLVGVLLVYKDKETFMYNVIDNQFAYSHFKVNATYFQVACGIYAALASIFLDTLPKGIFSVDELLLNTKSNYGKYLSYYMQHFIIGENHFTDGLLLERKKKYK
jgi:homospermidine synthase